MRRRLLIPEVIQTSATDCGPAALKALFAGYHRYLSYGRLREACQTDVDGTSIEALESMGNALGLRVDQQILPRDLLFDGGLETLPAVAVVQLTDGALHFVVVWRRHGVYLQVMDPAAGRLWIPRGRVLGSLYQHSQVVSAGDWTSWVHSCTFARSLARRQRAITGGHAGWDDPTHLDAALRYATSRIDRRELRRGRDAARFLEICRRDPALVPDECWAARPAADGQMTVRGAVVLVATGEPTEPDQPLPPALEAIRREPPPQVWRPVWTELRKSSGGIGVVLAVAIVTAAAGVVLEGLLARTLLDITRHFPRYGDRLTALSAVVAVMTILLLLDVAASSGLLRVGRVLDARFRAVFMRKIPRLPDRYFQSRLISDMASRAHALQLMRELPEIAGSAVHLSFTLVFTSIAIAWLYPGAGPAAAVACAASVGIPWLFRRPLLERDLRVRETTAALTRFQLDALLGLTPLQAHASERTFTRLHERQLARWTEASLRRQALIVLVEGIQAAAGIGAVLWIVSQRVVAGWDAGLLLLVFWAVSLPALGSELGLLLRHLPLLHSTILRFLEPVTAPETAGDQERQSALHRGLSIDLTEVAVVTGGHRILEGITLRICPGEHVAIVGPSGAGKSSLVGLLLGWHAPAEGTALVDGRPLHDQLWSLRACTAWIDPQVHLFHAPLVENLTFATPSTDGAHTIRGQAFELSGIGEALHGLPHGLQTILGDRGGHVSGGEGQRVRVARALNQPDVRLAILDEPARGLDRDGRRTLLAALRRGYEQATLLAITHDVSDAMLFDRVVIVEDGRITEQGQPRLLASRRSSRYSALLRAEEEVRHSGWNHPRWRRMVLDDGALGPLAEDRACSLV